MLRNRQIFPEQQTRHEIQQIRVKICLQSLNVKSVKENFTRCHYSMT